MNKQIVIDQKTQKKTTKLIAKSLLKQGFQPEDINFDVVIAVDWKDGKKSEEKRKQIYKPCTTEANEKGECVKPCQLKEVGICDGIKFVEVQDEQAN